MLLLTGATLVVTSALLLVTMFAIRIKTKDISFRDERKENKGLQPTSDGLQPKQGEKTSNGLSNQNERREHAGNCSTAQATSLVSMLRAELNSEQVSKHRPLFTSLFSFAFCALPSS